MTTAAQQRDLLRIVDANANRTLEGLRVCEDIVRFHFRTRSAFRELRSLRHGVASAVRALPIAPRALVQARASDRDIGKQAASYRVSSLEQLLLINFQRVKEALRALEECSRLLGADLPSRFQRLRFRTYEIERCVLLCVATLRHS